MKRGKKIKIPIIACLLLLTATILAAVTTTTIQAQNQSQNAYPLISAYLQGFSQSPDNVIQPKMDISSSITLNGSVYTEQINVLADDIVINGNGSTVQGPGEETGYGFYLNGRSNVTIFNVTVTGWQYGFYLNSSSYNNLTGNTATSNNRGFYIYESSNNLTGNTANNNWVGFLLIDSDNNNLTGNNANNNSGYGFYLVSSSNNNNLTGNNANNNDNGFFLYASSNNHILGNTALNSTTAGYGWSGSINNDFTGSVEANYLGVNVTDINSLPISSAYVGVETDGTILHFVVTDQDGVTPWLIVPYRTGTGIDTLTENITIVTVYYQGFPIVDNPRTVSMSSSHVETFQVIDDTAPVVEIILPPMGGTVNSGEVWIIGAFDGTGSRVTGISINDSRFTLMEPSGPPYGVTGYFSFIATGIGTSEFDVEVTVQDGAGHNETATRHIVVVVEEQSSMLPAVFSALMLSGVQGGVSPMVYAAVGFAAGAGVVAAVLFYYFRRMRA